MTREQVALLLTKASAGYPNKAPNFKENPQIFELWVERLAPADAEQALKNLNAHIDSNAFFPAISDILRTDLKAQSDYELLQLETASRMDEQEEWFNRAVPMPEHLRRKRRATE